MDPEPSARSPTCWASTRRWSSGSGDRCPTTVLVGENDTGLRASADLLAEGIPGAQLVVIPDAGHSPQEDQPQLWIDAVQHHLARV